MRLLYFGEALKTNLKKIPFAITHFICYEGIVADIIVNLNIY